MEPVARILVMLGLILVAIGLLWGLFAKMGFGRLPGDIVIEGRNGRIYIPIMSSIIISVVLTVVLNILAWIFSRFGG